MGYRVLRQGLHGLFCQHVSATEVQEILEVCYNSACKGHFWNTSSVKKYFGSGAFGPHCLKTYTFK